MGRVNRVTALIAALAVLVLAISAVAITARVTSAGSPHTADCNDGEADDSESCGPAGAIDDGADLLPQAGISVDQAIASAKTAATGDIGEVDLEQYEGELVFNVDVGDQDVKVDAQTGAVLAVGTD
jgi:uncharacterized membrane protein YkoI